jgi:hypothetical protein
MKRMYRIGIAGLSVLLIILAACSSTKLISSWKADEVSNQKFDKVLVIGLMGNKDRSLRENMEKIIVQQLQSKGINAGSAFAEYGPKTFEGSDEPSSLKKIKSKGYDGAITIALLDKSKEKNYNPGTMGVYPNRYRFWGYYRNMYGRIYEPGYYTVTNKFMLEANVYDLNADKLIYSAQTRSVDPASPQSLATEFSDKIFEDMNVKGVIK